MVTSRQRSWSPYRHCSAARSGLAEYAHGQPGSEKWMASIGTQLGDGEGDDEDGVDREELEALVPRRLALVGDVVGDQHREDQGADLEAVEDERHRVRPEDERQQDEH